VTDRTLTLGDLCCAIADGSLAAQLNGSMYEVNALELRRYLSKFHSCAPALLSVPLPGVPLGSNSQQWSGSTHTSVA
jgi:hypothetical protein